MAEGLTQLCPDLRCGSDGDRGPLLLRQLPIVLAQYTLGQKQDQHNAPSDPYIQASCLLHSYTDSTPADSPAPEPLYPH